MLWLKTLLLLGDVTEASPHCTHKGHPGLSHLPAWPILFSTNWFKHPWKHLALGKYLEVFLRDTSLGITHKHLLSALHLPTLPSQLRGGTQWTALLPQLKCLTSHSASSSQILHGHHGLLLPLGPVGCHRLPLLSAPTKTTPSFLLTSVHR